MLLSFRFFEVLSSNLPSLCVQMNLHCSSGKRMFGCSGEFCCNLSWVGWGCKTFLHEIALFWSWLGEGKKWKTSVYAKCFGFFYHIKGVVQSCLCSTVLVHTWRWILQNPLINIFLWKLGVNKAQSVQTCRGSIDQIWGEWSTAKNIQSNVSRSVLKGSCCTPRT